MFPWPHPEQPPLKGGTIQPILNLVKELGIKGLGVQTLKNLLLPVTPPHIELLPNDAVFTYHSW